MALPRNGPTSPEDIGGARSLAECSCIGMSPELLLSPTSYYTSEWDHVVIKQSNKSALIALGMNHMNIRTPSDIGHALTTLIIACIFPQLFSKTEDNISIHIKNIFYIVF